MKETSHNLDSEEIIINNEDSVIGVDSFDYMKKNGNEFFTTEERKATPVEVEEMLQKKKPTTTESSMEQKVIRDLDNPIKMVVTRMEATIRQCKTTRCSGITVGGAQYCYYCNKKRKGLIKNEPEDLTFLE